MVHSGQWILNEVKEIVNEISKRKLFIFGNYSFEICTRQWEFMKSHMKDSVIVDEYIGVIMLLIFWIITTL